MKDITATMVRDLREKTGAGMMDCKKALTEMEGEFEAAVDWLRKKGLAAAAKKAGRTASEGLIGLAVGNGCAAMVEVNAETDFVSRNEHFQKFVKDVTNIALTHAGDLASFMELPYGDGRTVQQELTQLISVIGENLVLRRMTQYGSGYMASYLHGAVAPGLGRIGVLVQLSGSGDRLAEVGKQIAMHVAAARPSALRVEDIALDVVAREKAIFEDQAKGRPEAVIEKMVEGRLRKFYEETVLTEQTFAIDGKTKIKDLLAQAGSNVTIESFKCFNLGEGIEKKEGNFADEVGDLLNR